MDECFDFGGAAAEGSLNESKMESREADGDGDGVDLGGGGAGAAAVPKRSSYEGAGGAPPDAEADLEPVQADPEAAEERAADMGAAFPCGRRPKSRARRPWKSSMPNAGRTRIAGSEAHPHNHASSTAHR
uniref:Uncharacterized protein n=1 Tax=Arundo donax TaxID=35708 RepID=A0A0A9FJ76_ARUDO